MSSKTEEQTNVYEYLAEIPRIFVETDPPDPHCEGCCWAYVYGGTNTYFPPSPDSPFKRDVYRKLPVCRFPTNTEQLKRFIKAGKLVEQGYFFPLFSISEIYVKNDERVASSHSRFNITVTEKAEYFYMYRVWAVFESPGFESIMIAAPHYSQLKLLISDCLRSLTFWFYLYRQKLDYIWVRDDLTIPILKSRTYNWEYGQRKPPVLLKENLNLYTTLGKWI